MKRSGWSSSHTFFRSKAAPASNMPRASVSRPNTLGWLVASECIGFTDEEVR